MEQSGSSSQQSKESVTMSQPRHGTTQIKESGTLSQPTLDITQSRESETLFQPTHDTTQSKNSGALPQLTHDTTQKKESGVLSQRTYDTLSHSQTANESEVLPQNKNTSITRSHSKENDSQLPQSPNRTGVQLHTIHSFTTDFNRMKSLPPEYLKGLRSLPKVRIAGERRGTEDGQEEQSTSKSCAKRHQQVLKPSGIKRFLYPNDSKVAKQFFGSSINLFKEYDRHSKLDSWIIHPFSSFRLVWTMVMIVVLTVTVIVLPISIAYFYNDRGAHWLIFNVICDFFFLMDMLLSFRTGYIHEKDDIVVLESQNIAKRYASTWFVLDLIGILPIDYIFLGIHADNIDYSDGRSFRVVRVAKLLELFKLVRVTRLAQQTSLLSKQLNIAGTVFGAIRLALIGLLLSHWSACVLFFVPAVQNFPRDSWVALESLQNADWFEQHANSWFRTISHMCGVGYGLATPVTMTDIWLSIVSMLVLSSTYIMLVGYFSAIVQGYDVAGKTYKAFMQEVDEYMICRQFPMHMRSKIHDFFDYKYGGKMFQENEVIEELSGPLRQEVVNHTRRNLIMSVPIFSKADSNFVNEVVAMLQYEFFQPGDLILKANFPATKMYFIEKGSVEIFSRQGNLVTRVKQGSYFGEIAVMTNCPRTATVRAHSYCKLYSLTASAFDAIITNHPAIYRAMALIAIKRMESLGDDLVQEQMRLIDIITENAASQTKQDKRKSRGKGSSPDSNGNCSTSFSGNISSNSGAA